MTRLAEVEAKTDRVRRFLQHNHLHGVVVATHANFAWLTAGGHGHVGLATERAAACLVVTHDARHVVTTNIEAQRLRVEELTGLGFEVHDSVWHEDAVADTIASLGGDLVGGDLPVAGARDVSGKFARLRWQLLPPEIERYQQVAEATARAVEEAARQIRPGMTEHQIAACMAQGAVAEGLQLNICLVGTDERAHSFRHPLPTGKRLAALGMLVLGARRWGLCASVTRMVHFGALPPDLAARHQAVCEVDATFVLRTAPGAQVADILASAIDRYQTTGFGAEWRLHHQGGATGYAPRDYRATPSCDEAVLPNQAFAWNPSIAGTKSEDTIIATRNGGQVLSRTPEWPTLAVNIDGQTVERPGMLVR